MADGSSVLVRELSDSKNQKKMKKVISKIIKKSGVLKDEKHWKDAIQFIPYSSNTEKCTIFFKIDSKYTATDEELTILIRPDNNVEHRVLRVVIQEGKKVIQKKEDYDAKLLFNKSDDNVYKKEIAAIEHDIKKFLDDYVSKFKLKKS